MVSTDEWPSCFLQSTQIPLLPIELHCVGVRKNEFLVFMQTECLSSSIRFRGQVELVEIEDWRGCSSESRVRESRRRLVRLRKQAAAQWCFPGTQYPRAWQRRLDVVSTREVVEAKGDAGVLSFPGAGNYGHLNGFQVGKRALQGRKSGQDKPARTWPSGS